MAARRRDVWRGRIALKVTGVLLSFVLLARGVSSASVTGFALAVVPAFALSRPLTQSRPAAAWLAACLALAAAGVLQPVLVGPQLVQWEPAESVRAFGAAVAAWGA